MNSLIKRSSQLEISMMDESWKSSSLILCSLVSFFENLSRTGLTTLLGFGDKKWPFQIKCGAWQTCWSPPTTFSTSQPKWCCGDVGSLWWSRNYFNCFLLVNIIVAEPWVKHLQLLKLSWIAYFCMHLCIFINYSEILNSLQAGAHFLTVRKKIVFACSILQK